MTSHAKPEDAGTQLAVERTRLAYERTMMAWVRTGTSLITFGFTIYKFFQLDSRSTESGALIGPREFALLMIGTGFVALLLAAVQHRHSMQQMRATYGPLPISAAAVLAALVSIMGLVAFVAVLFGI